MILICDCGSTKAEWVVLDGNTVVKRFITDGFNPNFTDNETMCNVIGRAIENIVIQDIRNVYFYGSGCGSNTNQLKVKLIFSKTCPDAKSEVYPDTLAACHALFGNNPGIACILGTGSNACVYDGNIITQSIVSLGFMLGDEGSGCHIGKRIVHDYFLGIMPDDLRKKFDEKYHLDKDTLLKNVYHGDAPSRYLAEFAKFANEYIDNQYIIEVVGDCFEAFINTSFRPECNEVKRSGEILSLRNQSKAMTEKGFLDFARNDKIAFVGSVAFSFQSILLQILENHQIKCSKILKNPMDGLIEYYKNSIA